MKNIGLWKMTVGMTGVLSALMLAGCSVLGTVEAPSGGEADVLAAAEDKEETEAAGSGNRLEEIKARGYLEVATEPYFAPNEFIDPSKEGDDRYVGAVWNWHTISQMRWVWNAVLYLWTLRRYLAV